MASPAPTVPATRVLVVEDEPKVARALREGLAGEGYDVVVALTGEDGFFRASSEPFDLLILDRMLPGREGLEVLRALRQKGHLARSWSSPRATRSRTAWRASTLAPTTTW
jgi:CheY-like chemotaxis protein